MNTYLAAVSAGVSVLLINIVGYVCSWLKLISVKNFQTLNLFAAKCCFFCMTFRSLAGKDKSQLDFRPLAISTLTSLSLYIILAVVIILLLPHSLFEHDCKMCIGKHLRNKRDNPFDTPDDSFGVYLMTTFPALYVNYFISGYPIFLALWDESEVAVITVTLISNDLMCSPILLLLSNLRNVYLSHKIRLEKQNMREKEQLRLASVSVSTSNEHFENESNEKIINSDEVSINPAEDDVEFSCKKLCFEIINKLLHNMFLLGVVFGLIYLFITSKMCTFVYELINLFADRVLPLSLFNVGAFLSTKSLIACNWLIFVISLFARLIIGPILSALFCYCLNFPARLSRQCIVLATMPTAATCSTMMETAGLSPGASSTMIMWSCVFMVPAVVLWLWLLDAAHLFEE